MLHPFYKDLCSPADTNFSVAPSWWHSIRNFLADSLRFVRAPPHTAIPVGAKLLSARHVQLCCSAWLIFRRLLSPISAYGFALNASAAPAANYRQPLPAHYMPLNAGPSTSRHLPACALPHMLMSKPLPMPRPKAATAAWVVSPLALPLDKFGSRYPFQSRILRRSAFPFGSDLAKEIASCEALAQAGLILGLSVLAPCCRVPLASPLSASTLGPNRVLIRCSPQNTPWV